MNLLSKRMQDMKFFVYLESLNYDSITAADIYTFYYMSYIYQVYGHTFDAVHKFSVQNELEYLKSKYLKVFSRLCIEQLEKYIDRGRINYENNKPIFDIKNIKKTGDFKLIDFAMNHTYRSDMERRNTRWNQLTKNLYGLSKSNSIEEIMYFIDMINNCVHNTYEIILSKLSNARELLRAFEMASEAKNIKEYQKFVKSSILQKLSVFTRINKLQ